MLKKILIGGVVAVVIILAVVYFARNVIVAGAVEEGGNRAMGVPTHLGSANVAIGAGSVELTDYRIESPGDFEDLDFFSLAKAQLVVDAGSVFDDEVVVDSLVLEGMRLNIVVKDTEANFKEIMNNIKELSSSSTSESEQAFKIGLIALRDIQVDASLTVAGATRAEQSFAVDNFELRNVGSESGATIAELTSQIVTAVVNRAMSSGKMPGDIRGAIDSLKEKGKERLKEEVDDKLKDAAESILGG